MTDYRHVETRGHRVVVVDLDLFREALAMSACQCEVPQPYTRPSGTVICKTCGGRVEPAPEKKGRP